VQHANERGRRAIAGMIDTARDVVLEDCEVPALVLSTAIVGRLHAILEAGASAPDIAGLRVHLTEPCVGYLAAIRTAAAAPAARAAAPHSIARLHETCDTHISIPPSRQGAETARAVDFLVDQVTRAGSALPDTGDESRGCRATQSLT
jgi:hypothetical protein